MESGIKWENVMKRMKGNIVKEKNSTEEIVLPHPAQPLIQEALSVL